jgi:hypothetical protein
MPATERALASLLLALVAVQVGCATPAPWQRGRLAKPQMALDPEPAQRTLREHVHRSREAATGAGVGAGGGCGCY